VGLKQIHYDSKTCIHLILNKKMQLILMIFSLSMILIPNVQFATTSHVHKLLYFAVSRILEMTRFHR